MSLFDNIGNTFQKVIDNPLPAITAYATSNPAALMAYNAPSGQAVSGGLQAAGGLMQTQQSAQAAKAAADRAYNAGQTGYNAATFRPVGMTTNFGSSNFQYDPTTGQMTSAGYQLNPQLQAQQQQLMSMSQGGLNQAQQAQGQYAPLTQGATNLMNLGNSYLGQSPEQVAQDYMQKQQALLQPGRDVAQSNLMNQLSNTGRTGLSIAQGGNLGAANPEMQALANARAMQDLQLAANAQQAGQQNTLFGANLLGQGSTALNNYYSGQAAAYNPYNAAMQSAANVEQMGQNPLTLSANLGAQASTAGARAGQLGLTGTALQNTLLTGSAATTNPYAQLLSGASGSMLGNGIANWLGGNSGTWTGSPSGMNPGTGFDLANVPNQTSVWGDNPGQWAFSD